MRKTGLALVLLALVAAPARARQSPAPGSQEGPLSVAPPEAAPAPRPFSDGTYAIGLGITAPKIARAVPAVYPPDPPGPSSKSVCILSRDWIGWSAGERARLSLGGGRVGRGCD